MSHTNNYLLNYSQDLFHAMVSDINIVEQSRQSEIKFVTFSQLRREIADDPRYKNVKHEETYIGFQKWFQKFQRYKSFDPLQAWIEVRSILRGTIPEKKRIGDRFLQLEMLTRDDYLSLGFKQPIVKYTPGILSLISN